MSRYEQHPKLMMTNVPDIATPCDAICLDGILVDSKYSWRYEYMGGFCATSRFFFGKSSNFQPQGETHFASSTVRLLKIVAALRSH